MPLTPIPLTTDGTGPEGAIPVTISGPAGAVPDFSGIAGAVAGATGTDLQAILEDIVARIEALEP